jgi:hypothetical protein
MTAARKNGPVGALVMRLVMGLMLALALVQGAATQALADQLAQSTLDRGAASLAVEKATVAPKETLRVSFTASETYPHDTFVMIVPSGTPHGSLKTLWEHDLSWQRLERRTGGVLEFTAPTAEGTYDLRMAESAEDTELASIRFTVRVDREAASLSVPKPVFAPKETMPVTFTASKTYPHDSFVFIVPHDAPHEGTKALWNHDLTWQRLERRTDGVLEFTAPTAEGTYDLRMGETSNDAVLTVLTFTVAVDREAASLSLPKTVFAPQEAMPVAFTASKTYPHDTFVFIVPHDAPDEGTAALWEHDIAWKRLERRADGELAFTAPKAEGTYDLRMGETSNDAVLTVLTFTVAVDRAAASLSLPKTVFAPQEPMPVAFTASATYPHDSFVFLVPHAAPHEGTQALWDHDIAWKRLERRAEGTLAFTAPKAEGAYDLRMAETSNDVELLSVSFTVAVDSAAASLSLPQGVFAPGGSVPVTFTASKTYPHDTFIFLVPHGAPHEGTQALWDHDLSWKRLERRADGAFGFTAPKDPGAYDLRMAETSNNKELVSVTFRVAEGGAGGGAVSARGDASAHDGDNPPVSVTGGRGPDPAAPAQIAASTGAERQQVFNAPMIDGHRLDICLRWGEACGEPAADAFCVRNGFERASGFVPDPDIGARAPTKVLSTGQVCNESFCDGFQSITCQGGGVAVAAGADCSRQKETYAQAARNWHASGRDDAYRRTMLLARKAFEDCQANAGAAAADSDASGASGWRVNLGEIEVSGSTISTDPPGEGKTSYYIAPASFHGDWTGARALVLEKQSSGGSYYASGAGAVGDVILSGPNGTARYRFAEDHSGEWKAFRVPLDGTGWSLDEGTASLAAVLSNVTDFRIRAEYGDGPDTSAIRGVMLDNEGPAAPDGAAAYAGIWDSSEGRMTLTAAGDRISGTYAQDNGAIIGTVTGMRFDGFWIEDGSGRRCDTAKDGRHHWGRLVFERTGDTLNGQWSYCDDAPSSSWTATRVGPLPAGQDPATSIEVEIEDDEKPDEPEKPDLTIREDLDVSGLIQQIEAIMAEEEGR